MSDFLAEARVLVRPDTTRFRAELAAQLAAATRGITVPVNVVASTTGATGFARLTAVQDEIRAKSQQVAAAQEQLGKSNEKLGRTFNQVRSGAVASLASLTGLRGAVLAASGPFLAASIAATAFIKSLQGFAQFEEQLNVFAATTEATSQQMREVSALAEELGADLTLPAVSASDAAAAMTELAKAGLSLEDTMNGARGVLQLATAAGISTGEAAQFAANQLNAFGLAGDQAVRVADVLANAANESQGSIQDFGLAFRQSSAVARQVGLTLEETAAQLTILARAGLAGSDAGTSLRVALLRLINPTKEAKAIIKDLGIDIRDALGNIRSDVFVQFGEATRNFTPAMRDAAFATVFGADAIRTVAIAAREGREELAKTTAEISETGTAAELAEARTAGFGGQLEALKSTASTAATNLGEVSTVIAGPLVASLTVLASGLNQVLDPFARLVRLSKEKLGLSFDPAEASTAQLLARVEELRTLVEDPAGGENFATALQGAILRAIPAVEQQRAVLQALGQDTTALDRILVELRNELTGVASTSGRTKTQLELMVDEIRELIDVTAGAGRSTAGLERLLADLEHSAAVSAQTGANIQRLRDDFIDLGDAARNGAGGVDTLTQSLNLLRSQSAGLSDELLRLQNAGAGPQAQIANLQQQEQSQFDIIANLKAGGIQAGEPTQIRAARQEIERLQGLIEGLQNDIIADQKAAASEAEKNAKEAQNLRDRQFEALAETFGNRQENIENAIERAGIEGNVQKQIRLTQALIASLQKERAALLERLRVLKVSAEVRKRIMEAITAAIEDAQQDILRFEKQIADAVKSFATPAIDLRIRIAQARDDVAAEITLRRQRLAKITAELVKLKNAGKKNTLAWLELKAQQQEEIAAINDLAGQDKTDRKSAQQFFFEQLQAQQGFAANLLGNLIPRDQTAGLVGVPSPQTDIQLQARVAEGRAAAGPSGGQVSTTNDILRRILEELKSLNRDADAPEAINQRRVGSAAMTGGGGNVEAM